VKWCKYCTAWKERQEPGEIPTAAPKMSLAKWETAKQENSTETSLPNYMFDDREASQLIPL
jgi:hypothetical protein